MQGIEPIAADHRLRADHPQGESAGRGVDRLARAAEQRRTTPILATWTYGLGKAVAFTTDAGNRWAANWTTWDNYDKLFSQMVRWSMRPVGDTGNFTVATDVEDGKVRVVVTALDKNDEFLNFLDIEGAAVGPDLKPIDVDSCKSRRAATSASSTPPRPAATS